MTIVAFVLASAGLVAVAYLAVAATLCICLDPPSDRLAFLLRITFALFVPVIGPLIAIRLSSEKPRLRLWHRWWLRPVRSIFDDPRSNAVPGATTDVIASAERILPGITTSHLPP